MPNLEIDFPLADGSRPLPGWRLRRLEMHNWGTFHGKVSSLFPDDRWTLLVGENGSGKSTAVDALRTLLVPPRLLNYNDASGEQKRRDRTRRSYIRGTWATASQEDSAAAIPQNLRPTGEFSLLLGVFANQHSGGALTLVQILWELNDKIHEIYAVARRDHTIREDLADLGQSRDLKRTLRQRGFDVFDSFSAYAEVFRSKLGLPGEAALEVFNQAIGVKEVSEINPFVRRHMLEGSDILEFIHKTLRPHFHELDASWKAIDRAERQLEALAPIASHRQTSREAAASRDEHQTALDLSPIYYAHRHRALADAEAIQLDEQRRDASAKAEELKIQRAHDQEEQNRKLQEIAADTTDQSIRRIDDQLGTLNERHQARAKQLRRFEMHLKALALSQPVENSTQFTRLQTQVRADRGPTEISRKDKDQARTRASMDQLQALERRGQLADELQTLRDHRVLIPREFLAVRSALSAATNIPADELPFAGELIEVKTAHRAWTGAIERLLHSLGISLLVPERHYLAVADFINNRHLGLRFTFHRVPAAAPIARTDVLHDAARVPSRLRFREEHPLAGWLQSEVVRRFHHHCCDSVQHLREVDYGITCEGLIREGSSRHVKDDRRAVNDASNFVLGWSIEDKIHALTAEFNQAEHRATQAAQQVADLARQLKDLDTRLAAIDGLLGFDSFAELDTHSVQVEMSRLQREKQELEASSKSLRTLREQLEQIKKRIGKNEEENNRVQQRIGDLNKGLQSLDDLLADLDETLRNHRDFDPAPHEPSFGELQTVAQLTLANVGHTRSQVQGRLRSKIAQQEKIIRDAEQAMIEPMTHFLRDHPGYTADLRPEPRFADDFVALRDRIEQQELQQHRQRFEAYLGTNLVGDLAMFNSKLEAHEQDIKERISTVNGALRSIAFTEITHVQIVAQATRTDDVRRFRAELRDCFSGGLNPSPDDRLRVFGRIRELIEKFERDDIWTKRVTDARNWFDYAVRELHDSDGSEANYYSGSAGKSGGQKARLAFTILASAIAAQYGLLDGEREADTFRLVVIDEAFARTDETNSRRALDLFQKLGLQLVVVSPFDAKSRIVEDYVDSFHLATNPDLNNSRLSRASRADYEAARAQSPTASAITPPVTPALNA